MKRNPTVVLCVIFAVAWLASSGTQARAFCYAPGLRVSDEYFVSDLILRGTVIRSHDILDSQDREWKTGTFYYIHVDFTYRGHPPSLLKVSSENSTSRFPMDLHQQYVLFLGKDDQGHWYVDNCGNSRKMSRSSATIRQLEQLLLPQSFVYGEVYSYGSETKCKPMQLSLHSKSADAQTTVRPDCTFQVDAPPGRYSATLVQYGIHVSANSLN